MDEIPFDPKELQNPRNPTWLERRWSDFSEPVMDATSLVGRVLLVQACVTQSPLEMLGLPSANELCRQLGFEIKAEKRNR